MTLEEGNKQKKPKRAFFTLLLALELKAFGRYYEREIKKAFLHYGILKGR